MQGKHLCDPDPERLSAFGGEQRSGDQRSGKGKGRRGPAQGRRQVLLKTTRTWFELAHFLVFH